jgi:hypothetical protein
VANPLEDARRRRLQHSLKQGYDAGVKPGDISGWKAALIIALFAALGTFRLWKDWAWWRYAVILIVVSFAAIMFSIRKPRR